MKEYVQFDLVKSETFELKRVSVLFPQCILFLFGQLALELIWKSSLFLRSKSFPCLIGPANSLFESQEKDAPDSRREDYHNDGARQVRQGLGRCGVQMKNGAPAKSFLFLPQKWKILHTRFLRVLQSTTSIHLSFERFSKSFLPVFRTCIVENSKQFPRFEICALIQFFRSAHMGIFALGQVARNDCRMSLRINT
jgi:hypothetical protein